MKNREKTYIGIDKDEYGGMSPTGNIIRDAWVFGILSEEERAATSLPDMMTQRLFMAEVMAAISLGGILKQDNPGSSPLGRIIRWAGERLI